MKISETIDKTVAVVGSQRELARLIGEREQHISDFKRGRPCSYQKHAQIAAVAGMQEEARRILLQGMADQLNESIPHEAEAKNGLLAILKAFPKVASSKSSIAIRFITQILAQNWHRNAASFSRNQPFYG